MELLVLLLVVFSTIFVCDGDNTISTNEYLFRGNIEDMRWFGKIKRTILFLTDEYEVHRSQDEGIAFENLMPHLTSLTAPLVQRDREIKEIVVVDDHPDIVLLVSKGTVHYISDNAGISFKAFRTPSPIEEAVMHPHFGGKHILVSSLSESCPSVKQQKWSNTNTIDDQKDSKGAFSCYKALYATHDGGETFELLRKYVLQFDWSAKVAWSDFFEGLGFLTSNDLDLRVLTTENVKKHGNQVFGFWDKDVNLYIGSRDFRDEKLLVPGGNRFLFTETHLFVAQAVPSEDKLTTEVHLQLSSDGMKTFYSGTLPFKLNQRAYTVLDTSENIVFLHVNHESADQRYGNVYLSDRTGMNYTFSLANNLRDTDGKCDFDKIQSIEGVYLANFVNNVDELREFGNAMDHPSKSKNSKITKPKAQVRTAISFDRGGEWSLLRAPKIDSKGENVKCSSTKCSLHLHGHTSSFAPVYSTSMAIGLVMGTGNVGTQLSNKAGEVNTYLSRDGGLNWKEVKKGSYIYEIGDHGGILVMSSEIETTKTLLYSWTQGEDWTNIEFTDKPFDVDNIIIEPTSTSRIFHVYGSRETGNGDSKGVIVTVDFTGLHERECSGADDPRSESSDYEIFAPRDSTFGFGNGCHLGRRIEYTRRKQDAACFNPRLFEAQKFVKNCPCTSKDYECDFGYTRESHKCVRDFSVSNETLKPKHCPASGFYTISNGYRLVGGDTCEGGVDLGATTFACSRGLFGVSAGGWFVLFVLFGLLGGMTYLSSNPNGGKYARDGFGTVNFGEESASSYWEKFKEYIRNKRRSSTQYFHKKIPQHDPMDFESGDFGDDEDFVDHGEEFDFEDEHDDDDEAELISATTTAHPLPPAPVSNSAVNVPKLSAPPTSALDIFEDDDDDDDASGDAV